MVTNREISSVLLRDSKEILKKEKEIYMYMLLSMTCNLIVFGLIYLLGIFLILEFSEYLNVYVVMGIFLMMKLNIPFILPELISNYFSVAITSTVYKNIYGGKHEFAEGLQTAKNNLRKIVQWTIFDKFYLLGIQLMRLLGKNTPHPTKEYNYPILTDPVWFVMKYLIPTIMIVENKNVYEAVERAGNLSVENWRIHVHGSYNAINYVLGIGMIVTYVLIAFVFRSSEHLLVIGMLSGVLLSIFVAISIFSVCLYSIFDVLCYHYSITGETPSESLIHKLDKKNQT
jgi:hypothetical protein